MTRRGEPTITQSVPTPPHPHAVTPSHLRDRLVDKKAANPVHHPLQRQEVLHGTGEPVVPGARPCVGRAVGRTPSGGKRERLSTDPGHRGGPSRSSAEAAVVGAERRGRIIRVLFAGQPPSGGRSR